MSCMTGFILVRRWKESRGNPPSTDSLIASVDQRAGAPRAVIAVTAVIGVVGLVLRFRSLADLTGYFTGTSPIAYDLTSAASVVATTAQSLVEYPGTSSAISASRSRFSAAAPSSRRVGGQGGGLETPSPKSRCWVDWRQLTACTVIVVATS